MNISTSMSAEYSEVERLRAFIHETIAEVAKAWNKFSHQDVLVEAFNGDDTATGYAASIATADKFEALLVAPRAWEENAYNRYDAAVESTNTTVAVIARKASDKEIDVTADHKKFLKRK